MSRARALPRVYYLGEMGIAFRKLLPFLEQYPRSMDLLTWQTLVDVIEVLWPGKFRLIVAEHVLSKELTNLNAARICMELNSREILIKLRKLGFPYHVMGLDRDRSFLNHRRTFSGYLKKKLVYGPQLPDKPYISIFPRQRHHEGWRNTVTQEHLDWLKERYPNKQIMGHGLPKERLHFDIPYCQDTFERINVLNNSEFLLTPQSGMAEFALACGCNLILTAPKADCLVEERLNKGQHNCQILYWEEMQNVKY